MKSRILLFTLLISACFVATIVALVHEHTTGTISTRLFSVGLSAFVIGSGAGAIILFRSRWFRRIATGLHPQAATGPNHHKGRLAIGICGGTIAILVLLFINGVWHIKSGPVVPRIVGLSINLLVILVVLRIMRKLSKDSK